MQLVERHIIKHDKEIQNLCKNSKSLYNQTLYFIRQSYFGNIQKFSEYELSTLMTEFDDPCFRLFPNNVSQQIIKLTFQNFKSFLKANKEYKKKPSKFLGKPRIPKYKKNVAPIYMTYLSFRLKNNNEIHFVKNIIKPIKTKINAKENKLKQIRIIPQSSCFIIEIIYEKKEIVSLNLDKNNFLIIDLGINNIATCLNNVDSPFIISGKIIKSFNQWSNKTRAKFQSYINNKGTSKRIKNHLFYRNNWMEDKMHKISRYLINYCIKNDIGKIIIGKNKDWKQKVKLSSKTNQHFLNIPHSKLIEKIKYKSELIGNDVQIVEESYTSKVDHLVYEEMKHQEDYKGRRKKRGLFQSSIGKLINADINGTIGIGRKAIDNSIISAIVNSGIGLTPYRINIL